MSDASQNLYLTELMCIRKNERSTDEIYIYQVDSDYKSMERYGAQDRIEFPAPFSYYNWGSNSRSVQTQGTMISITEEDQPDWLDAQIDPDDKIGERYYISWLTHENGVAKRSCLTLALMGLTCLH